MRVTLGEGSSPRFPIDRNLEDSASVSDELRRRCAQALVVYLLFLAFVLAQRDAGLAAWVIRQCSRAMAVVGPDWLALPTRVEFFLNVAMIVPAAFLVVMLFPRHPWANWVVYGFVTAGLVEGFQGLFRPLRSAQFVDVVANTAGVLIGVLLAVFVVRRAGQVATSDAECD